MPRDQPLALPCGVPAEARTAERRHGTLSPGVSLHLRQRIIVMMTSGALQPPLFHFSLSSLVFRHYAEETDCSAENSLPAWRVDVFYFRATTGKLCTLLWGYM